MNTCYRIVIKGRLPRQWWHRFSDMAVSYEDENTVFLGKIPINGVLHEMLTNLKEMNYSILVLEKIDHP